MTRGSETYYYHFNGHGDTIGLTDNAGNIVQTYKYDIWGNLLESTGSIENPFTYGGQWGYVYDSESSLYFLKTRYYDSSIGRFTSRDRFAGFENDSDSQNRYVYCQNDPLGNSYRLTHLWFGIRLLIYGLKGLFAFVGFSHVAKKYLGKFIRPLITWALTLIGLQQYAPAIVTITYIIVVAYELYYNMTTIKDGLWNLKQFIYHKH